MSVSKSLIQTLKGDGKVFSGQRFMADVQYVIEIYQNYEESRLLAGGQTRTPTLQNVELSISQSIQTNPAELLTLHMNDGHKLKFYGSGNACAPTGPIH